MRNSGLLFDAHWMVIMTETLKPSLIVIDDDPAMANIIGHAAVAMGIDVRIAISAREFMDLYQDSEPSAIVMDIVVPDMDGIEMLEWLADRNCHAAVILMSGHGKYYTRTAAHLAAIKGTEILGTLTKPFELEDLEALLRQIVGAGKA